MWPLRLWLKAKIVRIYNDYEPETIIKKNRTWYGKRSVYEGDWSLWEENYLKILILLIPQNLDALHDHLGTLYPGMRAPSFRCTERPEDGALILHYYSDRPGLEHIVIGIVKVIFITDFDPLFTSFKQFLVDYPSTFSFIHSLLKYIVTLENVSIWLKNDWPSESIWVFLGLLIPWVIPLHWIFFICSIDSSQKTTWYWCGYENFQDKKWVWPRTISDYRTIRTWHRF